MGYVVTVSGAVGGIGTSTFAYALALQPSGTSVLIDGQPDGVPLDVAIGLEREPGARWSSVRLGSSDIAVPTVLAALPQAHGVHVLSADREAAADPVALPLLVTAMRDACDLLVLDLPIRAAGDAALRPDLRLLLVPPTLPGLGAALVAHAMEHAVIAVDTGSDGLPIGTFHQYLEHPVAGIVRWQRPVSAAADACVPPPRTTDIMRLASLLWGGIADAA